MILICTERFGFFAPGETVEVPDPREGEELLYDHLHFAELEPEPAPSAKAEKAKRKFADGGLIPPPESTEEEGK